MLITSTFQAELPLVHDYLEKWASLTPDNPALIQHEEERIVNYKRINEIVDLYALCLVKLGVCKGDRIGAMGLKSIQYFALQYACFKVGAIICPLDIKLQPHEAVDALNKISARFFFMHGTTELRDFTEVGKAVLEESPTVESVLQYNLIGNEPLLNGAISANELFNIKTLEELGKNDDLVRQRDVMYESVTEDDGTLIIFTTGTTGEPKPALLHHKCIVAQMAIMERTSELRGQDVRRICILPDSHVGGTTITMYSSIYTGGTNVLLHQFHPTMTLEAIKKWKGTWLGGVPTMFRMIWALPNYSDFDISSLKCVYYAGAPVDKAFLLSLSEMAPHFGTSLGMTECAGGATYTPPSVTVEEFVGKVGKAAEDIAQISIRKKMNEDRTAGEELPFGEIGEICYHPPLVFKGYFQQPEETALTISKEGILYSGDIGCFEEMGKYHGLCLKGRNKSMIIQKGYNVFPDEVAYYISQIPNISEVEVVGVKHEFFDEGVFAFVIPKAGTNINSEEIMDHCKGIAAYKRPQHIELLDSEAAFPVNKNGKVDKVKLQEMAQEITVELRKQNKWDAKRLVNR